jgi:hypothetical protein
MMHRKNTIVLATVAVLVAASLATAEISINFSSPSNSLKDNGGVNLAQDRLVMVFLSVDESTSGFNNITPETPDGDVFLGYFDTTGSAPIGGRITGHTSEIFGSGSTGYGGQSLYVAVFDYDYATYDAAGAGSLPVGTYYGLGHVMTPTTERFEVSPTPTPDIYGNDLSVNTTMQLVPEPGTWALFGLGALVIGLRLRKRAKA